jgi:hypothetical protein
MTIALLQQEFSSPVLRRRWKTFAPEIFAQYRRDNRPLQSGCGARASTCQQ